MAGDGVVYLPLGVWSRVEALGNNLQVESGYLHSNKLSQTVVTCKYLDGKVTEVALKRLMRP